MNSVKQTFHVVAGGAGFVGVNLVKALIARGLDVIVLDNFSMLKRPVFEDFMEGNKSKVVQIDLSDHEATLELFAGLVEAGDSVSDIWHLTANSDIAAGASNPKVDLLNTFNTTVSLLEAGKKAEVRHFHFASSSAVYGDWGALPLAESLGPLSPISNYGAMKLASEAVISAARHSHLDSANIFRFPNVIGVPATHGVIFDFICKLQSDSGVLHVLGDGRQQKSYLHVSDLVDAMLFVGLGGMAKNVETPLVLNVGNNDEGCSVADIAKYVVSAVAPGAMIKFGEGARGWVGDVPKFTYDTSKLAALGWSPRLSSREAVLEAVGQIAGQLVR